MTPQERSKAYREAHKAEAKAYRDAHKAEAKAYFKQYYQAHKEALTARHKKWVQAHRDHVNRLNREVYTPRSKAKRQSLPRLPAPAVPTLPPLVIETGEFVVSWE